MGGLGSFDGGIIGGAGSGGVVFGGVEGGLVSGSGVVGNSVGVLYSFDGSG
ncbi:hypothetical protein AGMMS49531_02980 [Endomicrobiia bacterium]|nr:hypothetical protein AGMMS49531_02980 [Endomicrobiia bacterium]